jgi:hypothetical protein
VRYRRFSIGRRRRWSDRRGTAFTRKRLPMESNRLLPRYQVSPAPIDGSVVRLARDGRSSHDDNAGPDRAMSEEMRHASSTLFRGAAFLGACLRAPIAHDTESGSPAIAGRYSAKVIGNGLRELDRFLNLLIDAVSTAEGLPVRPGQHNTANKLSAYRAAKSLPNDDDGRLRALGRSRDCLFHCGGRVRRGDRRDAMAMTVGWPARSECGAPLDRVMVGQDLTVTRGDLDDVCLFYRRIAYELCGAVGLAPAERVSVAASR